MAEKKIDIGNGDRIKIERPFPWQLVIIIVVAILAVGGIAYIALTQGFTRPSGLDVAPISKTTPTPTPTPAPIVRGISFKVGAGSTYSVDVIPPWDNARVEGNIRSDSDINFLVRDPLGNVVARYNRVTKAPFSFSATSKGTYQIVFDNSFSTFTAKNVDLNYIISWR